MCHLNKNRTEAHLNFERWTQLSKGGLNSYRDLIGIYPKMKANIKVNLDKTKIIQNYNILRENFLFVFK